ncbi:MAG: hypothetical protein JNL35_14620 [Sphingopyxis sp.]|nr:hypothetical protein [Sphingopyxis sp.]
MANFLRRPLGIALGALATASLGGCYYGDVNGYGSGGGYAGNDCVSRYGDAYYDYDPYAYDDGYGYDCYDGGDYGAGFVNIGFGGGWYDNYYYPGSGLWLFDSYNNRYPLRGQYLNYWGGRRAWWKHHGGRGDGHWNGNGGGGRGDGRPGGRPGGWDGHDRDNDGPRGTRPPRHGAGSGNPLPTGATPVDPGRGDGRPGGWTRPGGNNDGPRGTRPPRPGAGNGTNPLPPTATTPVRPNRPDRIPGAGRPPRQDGNSGMSRPRQQWQGGNPGGGSAEAPRPRPGGGYGGNGAAGAAPRPAPSRAAPPARPAPPPATRSAPPPPTRSAPPARGPGDQRGRVREN